MRQTTAAPTTTPIASTISAGAQVDLRRVHPNAPAFGGTPPGQP